MRFVLSLSLFALLSTNSLAAPWDIVPTSDKSGQGAVVVQRPVQMQRGGSSNKLETLKDLDAQIVATGLGNIAAMALGADGTLYTIDAKSGRIWSLPDRSQDGKIDLRRPLPFTFDKPSGLAISGDAIFVADQRAVWVINSGQKPRELASLARANSAGGPHILLAGHDSEFLILGLTTKPQGFRLLEINKNTGLASLIGEGDYGPLHSLAQRAGSNIWAAGGTSLGPLGSKTLGFLKNQSIKAFALPGQYDTPRDWPAQLKDHIIASHVGPKAMQLIAIPTEFGQIKGAPHSLAEGFLAPSGRSAWGRPGPILMDKRGLFFADPHNGNLWRLSPKAKPQAKITIVDTASLPPAPRIEPDLAPKDQAFTIESSIKGTEIDASSTILKPSSIEYGSKLIKDYDEKKAKEEAEKAEDTPKKKRRMSRKRAQKDDK